jgi:hypothetical protein
LSEREFAPTTQTLTPACFNLKCDLKKIVCIHGEVTQCLAHAETLRAMKPKAEVIVPAYKQTVEI